MHEDSKAILNRLVSCLGEEEGRAVFREFRRSIWPGSHEFLHLAMPMSEEENARMSLLTEGIEAGMPMQYILGKSWFMGLELEVNGSVLIPRPETEELVAMVLSLTGQPGLKLLDLCTGSGCIAVALAKSGKWKKVEALDISQQALDTAGRNAAANGCTVNFFHFDLLTQHFHEDEPWDVWISNPPYVTLYEADEMDERVLLHEPHLALFVPDNDALIFYRRILELSETHLSPGGLIYLEINPVHAEELNIIYSGSNLFSSVELQADMSGKKRFLKARKWA